MLSVARTRNLVCLDFLASALLTRPYTSRQPIKYDAPPVAVVEKMKKRIIMTRNLRLSLLSDPQVDIYNSTLMRIRQAVKDRNIFALLDYWQHLARNNLLHFLGCTELYKISTLLDVSFSSNLEGWDGVASILASKISRESITLCCPDALNACMEYYLRRNHPDKVIQLYDKFIASIEKKKSARGSEDRESSSDLIPPAMPLATTSRSPHSGEASTLLAVIAAHAIKDDFEAAMNIYTSTSIRTKSFSQNDERLTRLKYNPKLVQRLTVWIPRLHLASLVSRPQMLHKLLKRYANEQAVQPIEKLYQCLKDGLTGRAPFLTTKSQKPNTPNRLVLPAMIWTSFLSALMKCQRRDLAASLWDDMISFGIRPGLSMWTTLIDGFDNNRAVDEALAAWKMMRGQNVHPDGLAYRAIISALFNGNKSALAMRTFDEFQSTAMKTSPTDCTLSVYNTVLHGLLLTNQIDEANNLLQSMPQTGLKPDLISYNTLLAYHSRRGDLKELANVINDMSAANIIGDIFTFSTILSGMLKAGREDAPKLILKLMRKQGIEPNVATYSAIINHHMKRGDEISVRAAFLMLQQMEADPQIHPNEVTYTSVLANLYRNTWLSSEQVEEWRKDIVQRMERRGVKFNLPTYHILIKACLTNTESEGLKNALWYYHDMRKRKIPMANTTWYILLAGLLHREEWNIADEMVNQMYTTGLQPSGSLSELVGKIKKRTRILDPEV